MAGVYFMSLAPLTLSLSASFRRPFSLWEKDRMRGNAADSLQCTLP